MYFDWTSAISLEQPTISNIGEVDALKYFLTCDLRYEDDYNEDVDVYCDEFV